MQRCLTVAAPLAARPCIGGSCRALPAVVAGHCKLGQWRVPSSALVSKGYSTSSGAGDKKDSPGAGKPGFAPVAAPFKGKCIIEGELMPMLDTAQEAIVGEESQSIEARVHDRTGLKSSSAKLMAKTDPQGMFKDRPDDCSKDKNAEFRVCSMGEHLDDFQRVYRRLRNSGRRDDDQRDVSDAILKSMHYKVKRKSWT
mmetsp:Transcript_97787/g.273734  ORF Transcript_97787/g.273734 Transcript_97787/m.273734 type:complete len:198 (-) Transcript_97787:228-821(-)